MNIKKIADYLEVLPDFVRLSNTLSKLSDEDIGKSKYKDLLLMLKEEQIKDSCISLDILESELIYKSINLEGLISFEVSSSTTYVGLNNKVRVCINSYIRSRDLLLLTPFKSNNEYTPTFLEGYIVYLTSKREGYIKLNYSPLILKDSNRGVIIYEFSTEDLGSILKPNIKDICLIR